MTLPIFPLTSVVLFPTLRVPLFIFEPRYREMIVDALAGDRMIGMVTIPLEHASETQGDPPVYPIGCAGTLDPCNRREDGTFEIVLHGTSRFRIVEEVRPRADQLYRSARVEWLRDDLESTDDAKVAQLRSALQNDLCQLFEQTAPNRVATLQSDAIQQLDPTTFINSLSVGLDFSTPEQQRLLEAASVAERYESMLTLVRFRLAELSTSMPTDSDPVQ